MPTGQKIISVVTPRSPEFEIGARHERAIAEMTRQVLPEYDLRVLVGGRHDQQQRVMTAAQKAAAGLKRLSGLELVNVQMMGQSQGQLSVPHKPPRRLDIARQDYRSAFMLRMPRRDMETPDLLVGMTDDHETLAILTDLFCHHAYRAIAAMNSARRSMMWAECVRKVLWIEGSDRISAARTLMCRPEIDPELCRIVSPERAPEVARTLLKSG